MSVIELRKLHKQMPNEPELDQASATPEYQLTVTRIIDLLTGHEFRENWYKHPVFKGKEFRIGSLMQFEALSGVSKSAIENLRRKLEAGKRVEFEEKTFYRLAALLNALEPPLKDPIDPLQRPIRFEGFSVETPFGAEYYAPWEELAHLHAKTAALDESLLPDWLKPTQVRAKTKAQIEEEAFLETIAALDPGTKANVLQMWRERQGYTSYESENSSKSDFPDVTLRSTEEHRSPTASRPTVQPVDFTFTSSIPDRRNAFMRISKLSGKVMQILTDSGFTLEEYAKELVELYKHGDAEIIPEIVEGLKILLFENKLPPDDPTLFVLSDDLDDDAGCSYGSDVNKMLKDCGISLEDDQTQTAADSEESTAATLDQN